MWFSGMVFDYGRGGREVIEYVHVAWNGCIIGNPSEAYNNYTVGKLYVDFCRT